MRCNNSLRMLAALIASFLISAPAGFAQNGLSIQTAQPLRLTVAPNASSPIAMKTLPNATCVMHVEGASDVQHKLFADDEGVVRFYVHPRAESDEAMHFEVDCAANGKVTIFPLQLRSSSSPTADMPAPVVETPKPRPGAFVRAALTEDEALHLSNEALVGRGYPLRPDAEQAPAAFATWKRAVTKPSTFVPPRLVSNPNRKHSLPTTSLGWTSIWSGFALQGAHSYDAVQGEWYVPWVQPEQINNGTAGGSKEVFSSFWIGLSGTSGGDLVQDGTEQDVTDYYLCLFGGCYHNDVTTYDAWTEIFPQQPEQVLLGFVVRPGDEIYSEVWLGDPCVPLFPCWPYPTEGGAYGVFNIENLTTGQYTGNIYTKRASTYAGGYQAEWIMERPTLANGTVPDLADYGTAFMHDAYALTASPIFSTGNWMCYRCDNNEQIFMSSNAQVPPSGGSDLLSAAYPTFIGTWPLLQLSNTDITYRWYNFH